MFAVTTGGVGRVEREVRVAFRMDIAPRAVDWPLGHPEDLDPARDVDEARTARGEPGSCPRGHERLDPGIAFEAVANQGVGSPKLDHEARPDLDIVGVLIAARQGVHLDQVAADGFGERLRGPGGTRRRGAFPPPRGHCPRA